MHYLFGGMIHSQNRFLFYMLWNLVELTAVVLGVLTLLGSGIWHLVHWHTGKGIILCAVAVVPILGRVAGTKAFEPIAGFVERKDLERIGAATLRSEAAALIAAHKANPYPEISYEWHEIPREELPPAMRKAAAQAVKVLINGQCVFVYTETRAPLSRRKCGYIITPPGSNFRPGGINYYLRVLEDGVFYIVEGV